MSRFIIDIVQPRTCFECPPLMMMMIKMINGRLNIDMGTRFCTHNLQKAIDNCSSSSALVLHCWMRMDWGSQWRRRCKVTQRTSALTRRRKRQRGIRREEELQKCAVAPQSSCATELMTILLFLITIKLSQLKEERKQRHTCHSNSVVLPF